MTKNILYTNEMFPVRLVFIIDILLTGISFVLSYYLCSFILPDIWSHGMLIQLPIIVALTSLIFLFIGIYKGYVKYDKVREVYSIFNAICLTNILTIILVVVNGKLFMEQDLMVPLSIIIVHSILSFSALAASRYLYKRLAISIPQPLIKNNKSILIFNESPKSTIGVETIISLIKKRTGEDKFFLPFNSMEGFIESFSFEDKLSNIESLYLYGYTVGNSSDYPEILNSILKLEKPVYVIDLKVDETTSSSRELVLTRVSIIDNTTKASQESVKNNGKVVEMEAYQKDENIAEFQTAKL